MSALKLLKLFMSHSHKEMEFAVMEIRTELWETPTPFGKAILDEFNSRWEQAQVFKLPFEVEKGKV